MSSRLWVILLPLLFWTTVIQASYLTEQRKAFQSMSHIYATHRHLFFCGDAFSPQGDIAFRTCSHCPLTQTSIQWMPIVSYHELAKDLRCYNEKICLNGKGQPFKGLKCCQQQDTLYQQMSLDLHNLVPETPLIKQARSKSHFGELSPASSTKKGCQLIIDKKYKLIQPPTAVRGMIARTYLYMHDKYAFPLTTQEKTLFREWDDNSPTTEWEKQRNEKIRTVQGNGNPYVR